MTVRLWEATPEDASYPMLAITVLVNNKGDIIVGYDTRDSNGRVLDPDEVDDLVAALLKAKEIAPKVAEAYECEKKAEAMVKQAREDRLAAIVRGVE